MLKLKLNSCAKKKQLYSFFFIIFCTIVFILAGKIKNINTHSRFGNNTIFPLYISLEQRTFNRIGYDMYRYKLDL